MRPILGTSPERAPLRGDDEKKGDRGNQG
jgi:hypothetical protein